MRHRRKTCGVFCCLFISLHQIAAAQNNLSFAFTSESVVFTGAAHEYVCEGDTCVSRLDWKDAAIPAVSFSARAALRGAFLRLNMLSAVPVRNGTMEDFDFLAGGGEPSLYSQHEAYLDKRFDSSVALGYDAHVLNWRLAPSIGFAYRNRKWTAQDGFLQYPASGPWTGGEPRQYLYGPVVSYKQAVWFPFITLETGYVLQERFLFSISGGLYPVMWGDTIDNHFLRSVQFYDAMREGFGWEVQIDVQYNVDGGKRIALKAAGGYEKIALKGNTAMRGTGISDDKLIVTEGYGSRMESGRWTVAVGFVRRFGGE